MIKYFAKELNVKILNNRDWIIEDYIASML